MKALFATLILSLPLVAQSKDPFADDPGHDPFAPQPEPKFHAAVIPSIQLEDSTLAELFVYLSETVPDAPNVAFKDGADEMRVSLALRNVTLKNLLSVVEEITMVEINFIDSNPTDASPGIIIVQPDLARLEEAGGYGGGRQGFGGDLDFFDEEMNNVKPANETPVSRAYPLGKLSEETVVSAIRLMWDSSNPKWAAKTLENPFGYHAASSLLIISAPEDRQQEAADILAKIQPKTSEPQEELKRLERELHRAEDALALQEQELRQELQKMREQLQEREIENVRLKVELEELARRKKSS